MQTVAVISGSQHILNMKRIKYKQLYKINKHFKQNKYRPYVLLPVVTWTKPHDSRGSLRPLAIISHIRKIARLQSSTAKCAVSDEVLIQGCVTRLVQVILA